jgi:hypothetical protein
MKFCCFTVLLLEQRSTYKIALYIPSSNLISSSSSLVPDVGLQHPVPPLHGDAAGNVRVGQVVKVVVGDDANEGVICPEKIKKSLTEK